MLDIRIEGLEKVARDLQAAPRKVGISVDRALSEAGRVVQADAKRKAPRSPTKGQASRDPRYRYDAKKDPGSLERSIDIKKGTDFVQVGVLTGPALKYARRLHDKIGWRRRGPGTRAKGSRAGQFFLTRALKDNLRGIQALFDRNLTVAVKRI